MATPVAPVTGEPAIYLNILNAVVGLAVTLNVGLTSTQGGLIVALIAAVFAAVTAFAVRPVSPAVFSGVVTAGAALLLGYHFHVNAGVVGAINALLIAVMTLPLRHSVSPVKTAARV